jgi:hypothetical protein
MSETSDEKGKLGGGHETSVLLVKDREHFLVCDQLVLVDVLKKRVGFHLEFNYYKENEKLFIRMIFVCHTYLSVYKLRIS